MIPSLVARVPEADYCRGTPTLLSVPSLLSVAKMVEHQTVNIGRHVFRLSK